MKVIIVDKCGNCPCIEKNDGGGHCSAFIRCDKWNIMLYDWDGPENFDIESGIHPDCKLTDLVKTNV